MELASVLPFSVEFLSDSVEDVIPAVTSPLSVESVASTVALLSSMMAVGPVSVTSVSVMGDLIVVLLSTCNAAVSDVTVAFFTLRAVKSA